MPFRVLQSSFRLKGVLGVKKVERHCPACKNNSIAQLVHLSRQDSDSPNPMLLLAGSGPGVSLSIKFVRFPENTIFQVYTIKVRTREVIPPLPHPLHPRQHSTFMVFWTQQSSVSSVGDQQVKNISVGGEFSFLKL